MRRFNAWLVLVLTCLLVASAYADDSWSGSVSVQFKQKGTKETSRRVIADGAFTVSGEFFTLSVPSQEDLSGSRSRKKLSLPQSPEAFAWVEAVAAPLVGQTFTVTELKATGGYGKKWSLKIKFTATGADETAITGTLKIAGSKLRVKAEQTASVPPEGATVAINSVNSLVFEPGFFSQAAQVSVRILRDPLSLPAGVSTASDTTVIEFPYDTLSFSAEADPASPALTVRQGGVAKSATKSAASETTLTRLAITRTETDGSVERQVLFAKPSETFRIPVDALQLVSTDNTSSTTRLEVSDLDFSQYSAGTSLELWHWDESNQKFMRDGDTIPDASGQQIVVLLHGWEKFGEDPDKRPQITTWTPLLSWATGSMSGNSLWQEGRDAFEFYSVRYDTSLSVFDNASKIQALLTEKFPNGHLIVLGYSMGGLVGHVMYQEYDPGIDRLVTLDAPLHGSPLVQLIHDDVECPNESAQTWLISLADFPLALDTEGATSLRWDGIDGRYSTVRNDELFNLNNSLLRSTQTYRTFAGKLSGLDHGIWYRWGNLRMKTCYPEHAGDGIVPTVSAHLSAYSGGQFTPQTTEVSMTGTGTDFDHTQIWQGRFGDEPDPVHFDQVLDQLVLDPKPKYQWDIEEFESVYISPIPGNNFTRRFGPTVIMMDVQNRKLIAPWYPRYIRALDGDESVREITVGIQVTQHGVGSGLVQISYGGVDGTETIVFEASQSTQTAIQLKSNHPYRIYFDAYNPNMNPEESFFHEIQFTFPVR